MDECFKLRDEDFVTRRISGETIIVPVRGSAGELDAILSLDPIGSEIWGMLGKGFSRGRILEALCSTYEVGRDQAERDLSEFLDSLRQAGLIEAISSTE
jgi:hypothetical protein